MKNRTRRLIGISIFLAMGMLFGYAVGKPLQNSDAQFKEWLGGMLFFFVINMIFSPYYLTPYSGSLLASFILGEVLGFSLMAWPLIASNHQMALLTMVAIVGGSATGICTIGRMKPLIEKYS